MEPPKDPRQQDWQKVIEKPQSLEIDHPLYHHAPKISIALGTLAALTIFVFANAPWWVGPFLGLVLAVMINRILRPRTRGIQIEDEI
jgi:hypothetical protein